MNKKRLFSKNRILFPAAAVLVIAASAVLLCGSADEGEREPITRVSVILPHKDDGYWDLIERGIREEEEAVGGEQGIDIHILVPQLNYSIPQMTDLLKQQIAAKVDYIVVQGNEDESFQEVLRSAADSGIEVVCVDTDIDDFPEHLYVGTDNYAAGRLLGEELAKLTGGSASVVVISGEAQYQNLQQRLAGFQEAIEEFPGIAVEAVAYNHYDALSTMKLYEKFAGKADTLVFLEGTSGKTLESLYDGPVEEYTYVVGFDAYEGAKKQALNGIVKQDTNLMGHQIVQEIACHVETGSYSSDCIYTDIFWVTSENYDEVMK